MGPTLKRSNSSSFKKNPNRLHRTESNSSNRRNEDNDSALNQVEEEEEEEDTSDPKGNDSVSVNSIEREMTLKDRQEVK